MVFEMEIGFCIRIKIPGPNYAYIQMKIETGWCEGEKMDLRYIIVGDIKIVRVNSGVEPFSCLYAKDNRWLGLTACQARSTFTLHYQSHFGIRTRNLLDLYVVFVGHLCGNFLHGYKH